MQINQRRLLVCTSACSAEKSYEACPSIKVVCPTRHDPATGQSVQLIVKNVPDGNEIQRLSDMFGIGQEVQRIYCSKPACLKAPCMNGGLCEETLDGFNCTCRPGYLGATCDHNINECASNPCLNGGTCIDESNSYTCSCVAGYEGPQCQTNINECASNPCLNEGTCTDGINSYTCACVPGYEGPQCQNNINECASNPCLNGATCTDGINGYTCSCVAGYEGPQCQTNINECASNPCLNGATCTDGINSYTCSCVAGYEGLQCQTNINECASNPCLNGATCTDWINSYTCSCVAGYEGPHCQTNTNECASNPCLNGATCTDGINGYTCSCLPYDVGTECQTSTASANDLRVVGGNGNLDGRLEIFHAGAWGTVCDDLFDATDCGVACRQMGYVGCSSFSTAGNGAGVIVLDNLGCAGSEQRLDLCPHNGFGIHNCGHHEDVGVDCATTVRLQGGTASTGRVEIFYKGAWGTICDDSWSNEDAMVICRMLGYAGGSAQCCASYGQGTGTIVMDDVMCGGDEEDIALCTHNGLETHNCVHSEDAGVTCS